MKKIKNKNKFRVVVLGLSIVVFVSFFSVCTALAGQVIIIIESQRQATIATDEVNFGSLQTLSEDSDVFTDLGVDGIVIDDLIAGSASWSLTISANDFSSASDDIPYSNLGVLGDDDGIIEVTAGTSDTTGVSVLDTPEGFSGSGAISDDITIISADNRSRQAEYKIDPAFKLTLPAFQPAGLYSNTLTYTFVVN